MSKYYDYSQEKYVEGDPMTAIYGQILGLQMFKEKLHRQAKRREEENARKAAEDKTPSYEILKYNGIQYIKELIEESFKQAETWMNRLGLYNELFVDYLIRKSYELKYWGKPEEYTLNLKQFKEICRYENYR